MSSIYTLIQLLRMRGSLLFMAIFALSFTAVAQQCPNISGLDNDETICETEDLNITSNIQHDSVINWTHDGDGSFVNGDTEDPTYIPGDDDIASGSVILTVNVTPYSDCPDYPNLVTEDVLLTIIKEPQPDAGSGGTVCAGDAILISDASIDGDYSSYSWNEDGDGSLTGTNTLSPTYEAAASEEGTVTITLTAQPESPCGTAYSDNATITINQEPTADAGDNHTICEGNNYTFNNEVSATNYSDLTWSTSGTGTFDDASALQPTYIPSDQDISNGAVTLTLTASPQASCPSEATDNMTLNIESAPTADAGANTTICEDQSASLSGSASNYTSIQWSTAGDGSFSDASALTTQYNPGSNDISNGQVTLTLTVSGNGPCSSVSDNVTISIDNLPSPDAGGSGVVCETGTISVSGASISGDYGSYYWTADPGDGNWLTPTTNTLTPEYEPGISDISNGEVTLTLHVEGSANCDGTYTDDAVYDIQPLATVDAGSYSPVCSTSGSISLSSTVSNSSGIYTWSTDGDGYFDDNSLQNPEYTFGGEDINSGSVILTMTASSIDPCTQSVSDNANITIVEGPKADAGSDGTVCESQSYTLSDATANYSDVSWATSGDGTFSNVNALNPDYTPGAGDISNGSVSLTLTVYGSGECSGETDSDNLTLTIQDDPSVNLIETDNFCTDNPFYEFAASDVSISNYTSYEWSSTGTGMWADTSTLTPEYYPSNTDIQNGQVTLILEAYSSSCNTFASDSTVIYLYEPPMVDAGGDQSVCSNQNTIDLSASASNYSSAQWSIVQGQGSLANANQLNDAVYTIDPNDISNGSVTLEITVDGEGPCFGLTANDQITYSFVDLPQADAGGDQTVCSNENFQITGASASNESALLWETNGDGSFLNGNNDIIDPTYIPGTNDINTGSVQLTLTAEAQDPCTNDAGDQMTLTIEPEPTVNAGDDLTSCDTDPVQITGATYENESSVSWSTNGSGNFNDATALNPVYNPSEADVTGGQVTLTVTVNGNSPCNDPVTDNLILNLTESPVANAGSDAIICENQDYTISDASASNYSTITWSTSGDGSFVGADSENPTYTPGTNDILSGNVTLTMEVQGSDPCTGTATDDMQLNIDGLPTADAGVDDEICEGQTYTLNGSASNYSSFNWSSSGTGEFTNSNTLTPTYHPTASDVSNGTVTITLTVNGSGACSSSVTSQMTLTIHEGPTADAGLDQTICEQPFNLNGTATNYSSLLWTSDGNGSFSDPAIEDPIYTPSGDEGTDVTLTLEVQPVDACSALPAATDDKILTVVAEPEVYAGDDQTICETTSSVNLNNSTESNTNSLTWTTSGDGNFSNDETLHPTYSPGTADIANGSVTLTLTGENATCGGVSDQMVLTINSQPTIDAGDNGYACDGDTQFNITSATGSDYSSVSWNSSGNGSFTNPNALNPTYNIDPNDYSNDYITLTVTAQPNAPCGNTRSDEMRLYFQDAPTADAGTSPVTICENASYTITDASASNYSSVTWSANGGDGTWVDQNTLYPTYDPGSNDINNGSVTLTLIANPISPCDDPVTNDMEINLEPLPEADAGDDETICADETITLSSASAQDYDNITWTTSGSGTFDDDNTLNAIYTPSAADIAAGTINLTLNASSNAPCSDNVSDVMTLTITPEPTIDAGSDGTVCGNGTDSYYVFDASATDYTTVSWTTSGDGNFENPSVVRPVYNPGPQDISSGTVTLEMTAFALDPCDGFVTDQLTLTVEPMPTVDVGADATICENNTFTRSANVTNYSSLLWTTSGTGTFTNTNSETITYTPSNDDITNGQVTLTLTADGNASCSSYSESDELVLSFENQPTADAGPDETICEEGITLMNASASDYDQIEWTSSGSSGTIQNANTISPTYIPSDSDINDGTVTLTLTATANSPCAADATDDIEITINANPTVDAGTDASICETATYTVEPGDVSISDYSEFYWASSGSGDFINANTLTPTYDPSADDIANGSVSISLHGEPQLPCSDTVTDSFTLSFETLPVVDAGDNVTLCDGSDHILSDASVTGSSSVQWASNGTGSFVDPTLVHATYEPSTEDYNNGSVTLTLTANSGASCNTTVDDQMSITFQDAPTADAGSAINICEGDSYTINDATAENYSSVSWTTSGNGTFTNANTLSPTYSPGSADIANGSVTLTLTAEAQSPCTGTATSETTMTISPAPVVDAGADAEVCEEESYTVNDASVENYSSINWSSSGSGTLTNASSLTPTYTPDENDVSIGTVVLTLTAQPESPCSDPVTDQLTLTVHAMPEVDAGNDQIICQGDELNITGVSASDYASLSWSTSGTGNFSDANAIDPIYYPSSADINDGNVTLTLTGISEDACSSNVTDSFVLNITNQVEVDAGEDGTICQGGTYTASGSVSGDYVSINWTHNGNGTITNAGTLTPTYNSTTADDGTVTLTLEATASAPCDNVSDQIVLDVQELPVVDAGVDAESCENQDYQITGITGQNYSSVTWTSDGTGTFSNENILEPVYIPSPADISSGSVNLTITADAVAPCSSDTSDSFTLTFIDAPSANAGPDLENCSDETVQVTGATASDYSSVIWNTSGDGTFVGGSENTLLPEYIPGSDDLATGEVTLTLTANGNAPCDAATDELTVTIINNPTADAGNDATICEGNNYTVSGASASDYSSLNWSSSGTGTINNGNTLNPTYTPSTEDIDNGQVTLTLTASPVSPCTGDVSASMTLFINESPQVYAGEDETLCEGDNIALNAATAENYSSLQWTTTGSGSFTNANSLNPTYTPSNADFASGSVTLQLTGDPQSPCTTEATDELILNLIQDPVADAGNDAQICGTETFTVSTAQASGYENLFWTTSGTGNLSDATTLTPTYDPSEQDVENGSVTLTLNTEGEAPCSVMVTDQMVLSIQAAPVADAGADADVCSGDSYTITDATAENYSSISWSTNGSGSFTNGTTLTPTYTPSAADFENGSVELTLQADPQTGCDDPATDIVVLTLYDAASANAGEDANICENQSYTLSTATADNYASLQWSTTGDGTFDNTGAVNPVYTPGTNDISNGQVTLTMMTTGVEPCADTVTDDMVLTISAQPQADAGPDHEICEGSYTLMGATASNYSSLSWTSSGSGTLTNASSLTPTYTPSDSDIANGSVTLTLTVNGQDPCTGTATSSVVLAITEEPVVEAGNDAGICEEDSYHIEDASAENASSVSWATSGDGYFANASTISPTYHPGSDDISNGEVTLYLNASAESPCTGTFTDSLVLSIEPLPIANAGDDLNACEGEILINDASAQNYSSVQWATDGSGSFTNGTTLTPTYTPSDADIANGSVVLSLTATAQGDCSGTVSDEKIVTFTAEPEADAGANETICSNETVDIDDASANNYSEISWSTNGTGTFSNENSITTTYTPSEGDIANGSVELTLTASPVAPCTEEVTDTKTVTINEGPTAHAGPDGTICENETFTITGASASDYSSITWSTSGSGTFSDENVITPTYTPSDADIASGTVTLTLIASPSGACSENASDELILNIQQQPQAYAGSDTTVCGSTGYEITNATAQDYSNLVWSTSGSGTFQNNGTLTPTYIPGDSDMANGSVSITLTAEAVNPCAADADDTFTLSLEQQPVADAGADTASCEGSNYTITDAQADHYASITWTHNGSGTLSNPNTINPTYNPSEEDFENGSVTLNLTAVANAPCAENATDNKIITLQTAPEANAGGNDAICEGSTYTTSGSASNYSSVMWTTSGGGTFSNSNSLTSTYTPSESDINSGSVTLTLTAYAQSPCTGSTSSQLILTIQSEPQANAGADTTIPTGEVFTPGDASASDYAEIFWETNGSGTFADVGTLTPTYTPSQEDYENGSVTLTLYANSQSPCSGLVSDGLVLTFADGPVVDAGPDDSVCQDQNYVVTEATEENTSSVSWTTSGTGTLVNANTLTPTYYPSSSDISNGSVVLTITGEGIPPNNETDSDFMELTFVEFPEADAGTDIQLCEGESYTLGTATASNYSSVEWTTTGTGTFDNNEALNPTYTPSSNDVSSGEVTLTLTAYPVDGCSDPVSDQMVMTIEALPEVSAGVDASICEDGNFTTSSASASNYSSTVWSTSGTGSFDDINSIQTTYVPSTEDINNGSVVLTLEADGIAPCDATVSDAMTLTISTTPTVYAGNDASVCEGDSYTISDADANNYSSITWSTSGSGSFDDENILQPTYTPSDEDFTNGTVTLTLTVEGNNVCPGTYTDEIVLTLESSPIANAGDNGEVCEDGSFTVSGASVDNSSGFVWTHNGSGTLVDEGSLSPTYFPGNTDADNSPVILTLTAQGLGNCGQEDSDDLILTVQGEPEAYAGPDTILCEGVNYSADFATAENYSSVSWTHNGDGELVNQNTLNPVYIPADADYDAGSVVLTLTAQPESPCSDQVTDQLILTLVGNPEVYAGNDTSICETDAYNTDQATAENYSTVEWTTDGDGTFSDANNVNTIYNPGTSDISNGSVVLTLTANAQSPCEDEVLDQMILTFYSPPIANAGPDATICETGSYIITGSNAENYSTISWSSSGDGSFTNASTLNPEYFPGSGDMSNGSVVLTLHVTGQNGCTETVTDDMNLVLSPEATVDVGSDNNTCSGDSYSFSGVTASDYNSLEWSTSGTGTFDDNTVLNPEYTPSSADIQNGSVVLTLTAESQSPCSSEVTDQMTLVIQDEATLDMGPDLSICEGEEADLAQVQATDYSAVTWTSSGDGTFSDNQILNPLYTPGPNDISNGTVDLDVEVISASPCTDTVNGNLTVTIQQGPEANAGGDDSICSSQNFTISAASAANFSSVTWTTSGTGTFTNNNIINSTYQPSDADIANGSVVLTLSVEGLDPCTTTITDNMHLTINQSAEPYAGDDATICEDDDYAITDATAQYTSSVEWSTSGSGTFDDNTAVNPVYTPGANDIANGQVTLTMTAQGYAPCNEEVSDEMVLQINSSASVFAGSDFNACVGSLTLDEATASDYASVSWTSSGTGVFDDNSNVNPEYTPSEADIANGSVVLTITAQSEDPCTGSVSDDVEATLLPEPQANAGSDSEACMGEDFTVTDATANNYSSLNWTTSGSGLFINGDSISPTYDPSSGDYASGSVTLTLHVQGNAPCGDTSDSMVLMFRPEAQVFAGNDTSICEGPFETLQATASDYSSVTWTTTGSGSFNNPNAVNTTYIPSDADADNGSVILTLEATSEDPCTSTVTDEMTLNITPEPEAYAGPDSAACDGSNYQLSSAMADNYSTLNWSAEGTGTFSDNSIINPVYYPSSDDYEAGQVILEMTANAGGDCSGEVTDEMVLNFVAQPTVNAGEDGLICETGVFQVNTATASNYASLQWSSTGSGNFDDNTALLPSYTPSQADINAGSVTLTLTGFAQSPCSGSVSDEITLNIQPSAVADAGVDENVCETDSLNITTATADNYLNVNWTTAGTGYFVEDSVLNPVYVPGSQDIADGSVKLTLTANSINPCNSSVSDNMTLTFSGSATADAGADDSTCETESYTVNDATATNYNAVWWTTSGAGTLTNSTTLAPTYNPVAADADSGVIVLTLHVEASDPCEDTLTSSKQLIIGHTATANAGANDEVCGQSNYTITGASAENYTSVAWQSSGTGSFINANSLEPTYQPSSNDVSNGSVTITLEAYSEEPCSDTASDAFILSFDEEPTVDAGSSSTICETNNASLVGSSSNTSSVLWTTEGDGTFTSENSLNTEYIPGNEDISNGNASITLTGYSSGACDSVTDNLTVTVVSEPEITFSNVSALCGGDNELSFASVTNYSSLQWTTTGTGDLLNANNLVPTYIISDDDIFNGSVQFTLTAQPEDPCTDAISQSIVVDVNMPSADAGPDSTICETESFTLVHSSAENYDNLSWSTSGSGTFSDSSLLHPVYNPSEQDIQAGTITLTLTATRNGCDPVSDDLQLTFSPSPDVNAGADGEVCETGSFTINDASVDNASSIQWNTSGTGSFSDDGTINPVYTPSMQDVNNGSVVLTLTAQPQGPCSQNVTDTKILNIYEQPSAYAGLDSIICETQSYHITSAIATNYSSITWSTNGDGTFDNSGALDPVYTPGPQDAITGNVTLNMTVSQTACGSTSDNLSLEVTKAPEVSAGPDATIATGTSFPLNEASVSDATSVMWSTSGTGTFNDSSLINPVYTPSSYDNQQGTVTLTVEATGNDPCNNVTDNMVLTIVNDPNLDFTWSDPCVGTPVQFDIDEDVTDTAALVSYHWEFGDGESSNQYEPSHIYDTEGTYGVQLTVTDTTGYSTSLTKFVEVNQPPLPFFDYETPACSSSEVQFHDYTNTLSGYVTSWHWDFGDGNDTIVEYPGDPDVTHVYASDATYDVTLTVETNEGCQDSYTSPVTVHPSPQAFFSWDGQCMGAPVLFSDESAENGGGDIISWQWNFDNPESGSSNTSDLENPEHTFTAAGDYQVQLIAGNISGCYDTIVQTVSIEPKPEVDFLYENTCEGETVDFQADTSVIEEENVATWQWDFGDGYSSNDMNPTHLYETPGSYDVTLTITTTAGCVNSATHTVEVAPNPMAQFDYNEPACYDSPVMFDDYSTTESGYVTQWHWYFGDGNDTLINHPENPNVEHQYDNPGDYDVSLAITTSEGCQDSLTKTVTVEPTPEVNFDYGLTCQGTAVEFEDLTQPAGAGDILSWNWNFGDPLSGTNNTSSLQNPTHLYTEPGDYVVTLTVETANGCSGSYSDTLTINEAPEVGFTYESGCLGDTVSFNSTNSVDSAAIDSYEWSFGDGGTSQAANPEHIYQQSGTFDVELTVTDTSGCSNSIVQPVDIMPLPVANFIHSTNTCSNEIVEFDDQSFTEEGSISSWHWEFGDGTDTTIAAPNVPDVTHQYDTANTYDVTLTVTTNSGCENDTTMTIETLQIPTAQFSFEGNCENEAVSFSDESQANGGTEINSWSWNFDDPQSGVDNTSTLPNPLHNFTEADTFDVQLVAGNTNGCYDTIVHPVGVNAPPEVAITASETGCQNVEMSFAPDTSVVDTLAIETYEWTFGDGSDPVYQQTATHTYEMIGEYTVTLTVTDTLGCVNEASTTVTVEETPTPAFSYDQACENGETQFTDESFTQSGTPVTSWYWTFGDPDADSAANHSELQNPTHVYAVDSTYDVKLVVQTPNGCTDSIVQEVLVNPSPEADFVYDTTACQGGKVLFADSSSSENSAITQWQWTFEEGYNSDLQNPSYTFDETDTCYDVQLVSYDALGCSDTAEQEVCVPKGFMADFSLTQTCYGDTTYFNDSLVSPEGDSIIAVEWNFGDPASGGDNVSDQHDPTHVFSQPGTYNITLEATNQNYCTVEVNHAIQVHALPEADFSYQSYACDSSVYISDETTTQGEVTQWIWHWGDGSVPDTVNAPDDPNISHFYEETGEYEVILEVFNNNGCYDTDTGMVFREPCVMADFELLQDTICQDYRLTFADSSQIQSKINEWEWHFGDGNVTTYNTYRPHVRHTYADTGTMDVSLIITAVHEGNERLDTINRAVYVNPTPTADFVAEEVCEVDSMYFEDVTNTDSALIESWHWDFGVANIDSDTSAQPNAYYNYTEYGEYDVRLSVMNEYGCRDTITKPKLVHKIPEARIEYDSSCLNDPTRFYDGTDTTGFVGQIKDWYWNFGVDEVNNDTSNLEKPEYVYRNEGEHQVMLQVEDEYGCRDTTQRTIVTHPIPDASFEIEEDYEDRQGRFNLTNTSEGATEYEWEFGNLPHYFDQEYHEDYDNPVIVYEDDGSYEIELVAWNEYNCPDTMRVSDSLLFKGLFIPNAFSPNNPQADVREFKPVGVNIKSYHIQVFDIKGNLLWESTKLDEDGSPVEAWDGTFREEPLPQGVYVWKAEAVFKDGTVWQGDEVGTSKLSSGKTYGTITLIR